MMKKRWTRKAMVVLCVILLFLLVGFLNKSIDPFRVQKVILNTQSHTGDFAQAELNTAEAQTCVLLYNLSLFAGEPNAEPCCDDYWLDIYFADGSTVRVSEGAKSKFIVNPVAGERFWKNGPFLIGYIDDLIDTYDLVRD